MQDKRRTHAFHNDTKSTARRSRFIRAKPGVKAKTGTNGISRAQSHLVYDCGVTVIGSCIMTRLSLNLIGTRAAEVFKCSPPSDRSEDKQRKLHHRFAANFSISAMFPRRCDAMFRCLIDGFSASFPAKSGTQTINLRQAARRRSVSASFRPGHGK